MMKSTRSLYLALIFLLCICPLFLDGQTVQELEDQIKISYSGEPKGLKVDVAYQLLELDTLNYWGLDYIFEHDFNKDPDSVRTYFEWLHEAVGTRDVYLRKYRFSHLIQKSTTEESNFRHDVQLLREGLRAFPGDEELLYLLAMKYYGEFIRNKKSPLRAFTLDPEVARAIASYKLEHPEEYTDNYIPKVDSLALATFYELWEAGHNYRFEIYFAIRQLETYGGVPRKSLTDEKATLAKEYCYFSPLAMMDLEPGWERDTAIDYTYAARRADVTFVSSHLASILEPCVKPEDLAKNDTVYRMVWLSTFRPAICVRINIHDGNRMVTYKKGHGLGGYDPKGLAREKRRKFRRKHHEIFLSLLREADFASLRGEDYMPTFDGTTWIMQEITAEASRTYQTNNPSMEFADACRYLLGRSGFWVGD